MANSYLTKWEIILGASTEGSTSRIHHSDILIKEMSKNDLFFALEYVIDTYYDGKYTFYNSEFAIRESPEALRFMYKKSKWRSDDWNGKLCEKAASLGKLDALKVLHEEGCPWNVNTLMNSISSGCMGCFRYAHDNGCIFPHDIFLVASPSQDGSYYNFIITDYYHINYASYSVKVSPEFYDLVVEKAAENGARIRRNILE